MQNSCMPDRNNIIHTKDDQPYADPPQISCLVTVKIIAKNAAKQRHIPSSEDRARGAVENATMPSIE